MQEEKYPNGTQSISLFKKWKRIALGTVVRQRKLIKRKLPIKEKRYIG